jgi:hypothetical protein
MLLFQVNQNQLWGLPTSALNANNKTGVQPSNPWASLQSMTTAASRRDSFRLHAMVEAQGFTREWFDSCTFSAEIPEGTAVDSEDQLTSQRNQRGTAESDDTFHGVQCLSMTSDQVIVEYTGLPDQYHPFPEFLTLSTVLTHLGLLVLFHTKAIHRLQAFRAFPTQTAVTPLSVRYSHDVGPAPVSDRQACQNPLPLSLSTPSSLTGDRGGNPSNQLRTPLMSNSIIQTTDSRNYQRCSKSGRNRQRGVDAQRSSGQCQVLG